MHSQSESHLRQMLVVGENAGKHIDSFSKQFMDEFIFLLSRRYNTQRVRVNQVYQEYIQDKHHLHMNSTKWVTLTDFVKYLGREGIVRADENEKGWWISWIDNSPKALARQAELQKRERADMDEEQRQRKQLKEQIERARLQAEALASAGGGSEGTSMFEGLNRDAEELAGGKIALSFGGLVKPSTSGSGSELESKSEEKTVESGTISEAEKLSETAPPPSTTASSTDAASIPAADATAPVTATASKFSLSAIGTSSNALKRPAPGFNAFKVASKAAKKSSSSDAASSSSTTLNLSTSQAQSQLQTNLRQKKFLTAAERLMLEDIEREKRKSERMNGGGGRTGYQGMGPQRGGR